MKISACPNCGRQNLYQTRTGANGGHGPTILPGLGAFFKPAKIDVVVCADCGLTRLFAAEDERGRIKESGRWSRVPG